VAANLLAADAALPASAVMNVATGEPHTLNGLVETLNGLLGTDLDPVYADERAGDVSASHADISTARRLIGYEPHVDFEAGLRRTIDYLADALALDGART
jgi:nucleoside-diphosphate-sugar epimerase